MSDSGFRCLSALPPALPVESRVEIPVRWFSCDDSGLLLIFGDNLSKYDCGNLEGQVTLFG